MAQDNKPNGANNETTDGNITSLKQELHETFRGRIDPEILDSITETIINKLQAAMAAARAAAEKADHAQHTEMGIPINHWNAIEKYVTDELKKPVYNGKTLDSLSDSEKLEVIENAIAAAELNSLPVITVNKYGVDKSEWPLDKINNSIWDNLQGADPNGQITMGIKTGQKGNKIAEVLYSIDFAALEKMPGVTITKHLTAFDKRCYIAAGALFNNGYPCFTVAQLYAAMGNNGRPNANDIKKINDSLTKMRSAVVFIDNDCKDKTIIENSELSLFPNYKLSKTFPYDGNLLPMERISAVVNGQTVDSAINLFREPPLISFAKERKQITTINRNILESPLNKTEMHLKIEDYLIEQISFMKKENSKINKRMLFNTFFEKIGIQTRLQRQRAKEDITKYLDYYKQIAFIKDYSIDKDGINIIC